MCFNGNLNVHSQDLNPGSEFDRSTIELSPSFSSAFFALSSNKKLAKVVTTAALIFTEKQLAKSFKIRGFKK